MGAFVDVFVQRFVNKMQMSSFGALTNQLCVVFVVLFFTVQSGRLLAAANPMYHSYGIQLATLVVGTIVAKLITNTVSERTVRTTSKEHMEGQAKIEEAKAAATQLNLTAERAAIKVNGGTDAGVRSGE